MIFELLMVVCGIGLTPEGRPIMVCSEQFMAEWSTFNACQTDARMREAHNRYEKLYFVCRAKR